MKTVPRCVLLIIAMSLGVAVGADNPFIGRWALTIPGGGAGWLGVNEEGGILTASILWGGGSVMPTNKAFIDGDTLNVVRLNNVERKDTSGNTIRDSIFGELITAKVSGDMMQLTQIVPSDDGKSTRRSDFTGKRIPALPPRPDLSKIKFSQPIQLFNGTNLNGWKLTDENAQNGWSVEKGVLINRPTQEEGKPHINYGNLRTVDKFEDFNLKLETNIPKGGNSGIYLRGIYEVQVADTAGRGLDSHNMGGIYSRITPRVSAEKPAGEWQSFDITLCNRHVTVILNGQKIIDNEPLLGCTGGALSSDEFKPGPIYLQGDHTGINYRNIVLTPILKTQAGTESVLFEDNLDARLSDGWAWIRENPSAHRFQNGGLEIRVEPGLADSVKNALVRKAPARGDGKIAVEVTVTNTVKPTQQYEQAGITWYHDGKAVFKLVKELVDGQLLIIPGRKPMTADTVQLRLVIEGNRYIAQFRPDGTGDFQTAESGTLPPPGDDQVSIQCYNGPQNADHWIRFKDFRIVKLSD